MAFVVQQDNPVADANAYIDGAFFASYHADRGNTYTATTEQIEQAIVRATSYADTRFNFVGCRSEKDQTTEFPRDDAYDDRGDSVDGIPTALKQAIAEYTLRALVTTLMADPARDASGRAITEKSESVGPLKETVKYADGVTSYDLPDYPVADRILRLRGLLVESASGGGLRVGTVARG